MRRCKWLRRSTINYEITNVNNENDSLTSLVETGLLQDSKKVSFFLKCISYFFSSFKYPH